MTDDDFDPFLGAKPARDLEELVKLKIFLTGPNGSGKSSAAARFARPWVGVTELQAIPTIRANNPSAMIFHNREGLPGIRSAGDLADFMRSAKVAHEKGFDAVVLDGLTDAQRLLRQAHTTAQGGSGKAARKTSTESWGFTIDDTARVCRVLRDLPIHVLVTCLTQEVEQNEVTAIRPSLNGKKLPGEVGQYFNLVGYAHAVELPNGKIRHQVLFRAASDSFLVKGMGDIKAIEPPEPLWWSHRALGTVPTDEVEARVQEWRGLVEEEQEDED